MKRKTNYKNKGSLRMVQENGKTLIFLYGDIEEGSQSDPLSVVNEIMKLQPDQETEFHINSNGGEVYGGISIFNALKNSRANISIYIDGVAASMAAVIALCGKPLYMSMFSRIMLHCASGGAYGSIQELSSVIKQMEIVENDLSVMLASRCKMKPEDIRKTFFDGEDHWLTAQEALNLGFIDEIISNDVEPMKENDSEGIYDEVNRRFNSRFIGSKGEDLYTRISKIPAFYGMDEDSIFEHIKGQKPQNLVNMLSNALAKGFISGEEMEEMKLAYKDNLGLLKETLEHREERFNRSFDNMYNQTLNSLRNHSVLSDRQFIEGPLKDMAKGHFNAFKRLIESKPKRLLKDELSNSISTGETGSRYGWTLEDYRKKAPNELRRNPNLYQRLLENEKK